MKWILIYYRGMATPVHAMMGILGVCVVAFSFAGALGGFMEKFTFAVFFLYGIFLFYCAFFSGFLVVANKLEDDDPKRETLIGLSYIYQGVLISLIFVMTWWVLSTFIGKATNLMITVSEPNENIIRELEKMTYGDIEYDGFNLELTKQSVELELSGFISSVSILKKMIEYTGSAPAKVEMKVKSGWVNSPGYKFLENETVEILLDIDSSMAVRKPYLNGCYIAIPILSPDISTLSRKRETIYPQHDYALNIVEGIELVVDGVSMREAAFIEGGGLMMRSFSSDTYSVDGGTNYCQRPIVRKDRKYFTAQHYRYYSSDMFAKFVFPSLAKYLMDYEVTTRKRIRSWGRFQYHLRSGFEGLFI